MYERKALTALGELKTAGEDAGSVEAVFSTGDRIDSAGDVTRPTAFTDGQRVRMVWNHDWEKVIGSGTVRIEENRAVFKGRLNQSSWGRDAYEVMKESPDLQQFSFGYEVLKRVPGEFQGEKCHYLEKVRLFEVSPVLIGANENTHLLAIKSDLAGVAPAPDAEHAVVASSTDDGLGSSDGDPVTKPSPADDPVYDPDESLDLLLSGKALSYAEHYGRVLAVIEAWCDRSKSLGGLRSKSRKIGRPFSETHTNRIRASVTRIREGGTAAHAVANDLEQMLADAEPAPKDDAAALFLAYQRTLAHLPA